MNNVLFLPAQLLQLVFSSFLPLRQALETSFKPDPKFSCSQMIPAGGMLINDCTIHCQAHNKMETLSLFRKTKPKQHLVRPLTANFVTSQLFSIAYYFILIFADINHIRNNFLLSLKTELLYALKPLVLLLQQTFLGLNNNFSVT